MPHKHKRKRGDDSSHDTTSTFDLPPTSRARTLSVHQKHEPIFTAEIEKKKQREERREKKVKKRSATTGNNEYRDDDTPKAFKRLLAFQQLSAAGRKMPSGLDDGGGGPGKKNNKKKKGEKKNSLNDGKRFNESRPKAGESQQPQPSPDAEDDEDPPPPGQSQALKILPTESLSTFSQRVDQSLPLTSIPKHRTRLTSSTTTATDPSLPALKPYLTKHNKRLSRLQSQWRADDARLREKEAALADEQLEAAEARDVLWLGAGVDPTASAAGGKKKKKGKGGKGDDDADPWKVLEKKRREQGALGRQSNVRDVVLAPPTLGKVRNIFKV